MSFLLGLLSVYLRFTCGQGWAARQDGNAEDYALALSTDSEGNVYVAGHYLSSLLAVYDSQGQCVLSLTKTGLASAYMVKYAANGSLLWAARQDGNSDDYASSLSTDPTGNVYVAGYSYSNPFVVYDGLGRTVKSQANSGGSAAFIIKYTVNGSFLWAARQDGFYDEEAKVLSTDYTGDVYVGGSYSSPPMTVYDALGRNAKQLAVTFTTQGAYVVRYKSNGSFAWAARHTALGYNSIFGLSTDMVGNVYVAGRYQAKPLGIYDASDVEVKQLQLTGTNGGHIVKYVQNGTFAWVARMDGVGGSTVAALALTTDQIGNAFVAGYYQYSPLIIYDKFGVNVTQLNISGSKDAFVVKYAYNGSFLWVARLGYNDAQAQALSIDQAGNVYVAGYTVSSLFVYDALGTTAKAFINGNASFGFVVKFSSNGASRWAAVQDGGINDIANAVSTDQSGNLFVAGQYSSTSLTLYDAFGLNLKSLNISGPFAGFLVKYTQNGDWNNTQVNITQNVAASTQPSFPSYSTQIIVSSSLISSSSSFATSLEEIKQSSAGSFTSFITDFSVSSTLSQSASTQENTSITSSLTISTLLVNQIVTGSSDAIFFFSAYLFTQTQGIFSSQTQPQVQPNVVGFNNANLLIYVLLVVGFLTIAVCICAVCCFCRYRRIQKVLSDSNVDGFVDSSPTNTFAGSTTMTTAMVTSHVLAIPQYMVLDFGVDFRQLELIAKGGGGSIYRCQTLDIFKFQNLNGAQLVVKNLGNNVDYLSANIRASFYQEVSMLNLFRDQVPFARMYGFSEKPATILLKFYELGSLEQFIMGLGQSCRLFVYSQRQLMHLLVQMSQGFAFMHQNSFAHCDVKPANILLEPNSGLLEPRITDFGISRLLDSSVAQVKMFELSLIKGASLSYAAPEVLLRFRQSNLKANAQVWKQGDVYAFGMVVMEALNRKTVWYR